MILLVIGTTEGSENLYGSVIRIHVLANSDSPEDQETKLLVRDKILEFAEENLSGSKGLAEAEEEIRERIPQMEEMGRAYLKEIGKEDRLSITLTTEYYPTREYDSLSLPAGDYLSLRVLIGEAEGQNWWCILFPPTCLTTATEKAEDALLDAGMEEKNVKTITREGTRFQIRFKILEIVSQTREKIRRLF